VNLEVQQIAFIAQLKMAKNTGLPIVIHCRDREIEVYELLKRVIFLN
jgi:TatD DNase family protein